MDPTSEEQDAINTIADAADWAGVTDSGDADGNLRSALLAGLGAPSLMREIAFIETDEFKDVVSGLLLGPFPVDGTDPPQIKRTPVQEGRCWSLRRVCRLRCGLPAESTILSTAWHRRRAQGAAQHSR